VIVGVISDTHGLLRPEAISALGGSDLIVHAGDVGKPDVLDRLQAIAPTTAVRGNVDSGEWARGLPVTAILEASGLHFYVLHDLTALDVDPVAAGLAAVITGHTHRPHAESRGGVLYLNPGAAGPRRFSLPVAVARVRIEGTRISHEIIELSV